MSSRGCVSWLNVARALASTTRQTAKRGAALWAAMCCAAALWSTPLLGAPPSRWSVKADPPAKPLVWPAKLSFSIEQPAL